tara:strand:- start:1360 stop:1503 length:144 start_codon:yes stop_codon:yes gene_type:complete
MKTYKDKYLIQEVIMRKKESIDKNPTKKKIKDLKLLLKQLELMQDYI